MAQRNTNCLAGLACPKCQSLGRFRIGVSAFVTMSDEGSEECEDIEWDNDAPCICLACQYSGRVSDFSVNQ